jgi:hypothetical protein
VLAGALAFAAAMLTDRGHGRNWQTPKLTGTCLRVTMATIEGSSPVAYFKLK